MTLTQRIWAVAAVLVAATTTAVAAQPADAPAHAPGGEANLVLPDLTNPAITFLGMSGHSLLMIGLLVCAVGLLFGVLTYVQLQRMPVHKSMRDVSELIYETCKAYLAQQGRFLMLLWIFIGAIVAVYFGILAPHVDPSTGAVEHGMPLVKVLVILLFSLIGMAGSFAVAWFGIRVNTFANSRAAFASLRGKPFPCYAIPLKAGMSIGMALISVELLLMLVILLFLPRDYAGACFIGFAIGESLGAAAL
jgi:K(+)-stimulated pyrophosphate-energized sodium pump